jgi:hypothetical protein
VQIPIVIILLAGGFQLARVFYTYHTLQKAVNGGASLLARSTGVNYCDPSDANLVNAKNFIVYGNLQGIGTPVVQGSLCDGTCLQDLIQIVPERQQTNSTTLGECTCGQDDVDSCDASAGGRAPDFIVVNLGPGGFPLQLPFAYLSLGTINLRVSVRMPVTGS